MAAVSAREAAYQKLRGRIIRMELKPGDALNDRELAEEMGISRTPVREAIIMLNLAHMVTIKPQSGTHVAPIDLKLMEMEQFARFTLEKEMLCRIRGRLTAEQAAGYRTLMEQYDQLYQSTRSVERDNRLLEMDNAFHRRAFELNGMEAHFDHLLSSFQHIERLRMFSLMSGENMTVVREHTRILEAVLHGRTEDVERALNAHLSRYKISVEEARRKNPEYFIEG
ncbi:MAG: GntR family transcriptional regulator [Faecalibacterium sp.]